MKLVIYVASDDDLVSAEELISVIDVPEGDTLTAVNLYGAEFSVIPAEVLQVLRLKRTGVMPLTFADEFPVLSGRLPTVEDLETVLADGVTESAIVVTEADSAVDFATNSRIHMSWLVNDLAESTRFYEVFFGQPPTKVRDDYVKFELEDPPLNFAFSQDRKPQKGAGPLNHMGVQLKSSRQILEARDRFKAAGFTVEEEIATSCCYAVQTKIWIGDPDGNRWELFVTTEPDADEGCGPECICYAEISPSRVAGPADSTMPVSV
ncbi:MAG TPA: ArsI/CadI family heavy metal resistance metalloenzyme [Acidobacteriaceae bacterium]|nr:ArsI/CadI family heavy metal resistance metalloenzyme [Acidobacteriaceae bacterium]